MNREKIRTLAYRMCEEGEKHLSALGVVDPASLIRQGYLYLDVLARDELDDALYSRGVLPDEIDEDPVGGAS